MIRLPHDPSTVELTNEELALSDGFETALDNGLNIAEAVAHTKRCHPFPDSIDPAFWRYLLEP